MGPHTAGLAVTCLREADGTAGRGAVSQAQCMCVCVCECVCVVHGWVWVCLYSGTEMSWVPLIAPQIQVLDKIPKVISAELPAECRITQMAAQV